MFLRACVIVMVGMGYKANNFCSLYKRLTCAHPHHSSRPVATSAKKKKTTETSQERMKLEGCGILLGLVYAICAISTLTGKN